MAKLVIKSEGLPPQTIELKRGLNRIGRSSVNDFKIEHPSVSRFHCEIELKDEAMTVRDMDSSNGTYVNGESVVHSPLTTGQKLRMGDIEMLVEEAPLPPEEREFVPCCNHPKHPASMECSQCKKIFCGACIHVLARTGGKILRLCPVCSGHCVPLAGMNAEKKTFLGGLLKKILRKPPEEKPFHD